VTFRSCAVTLALVGWYLMVPPKAGVHAPLSEWVTLFSFDTALECHRADIAMIQVLEKYKKPESAQILEAMTDSECIASDDPRLKGN
jgi:hypothetical protein